MTLTPGTRVGPYTITALLGAGGMGEVYKASDARLDRTVAIKVLPEHVASDPELKQRFEREAKTLAALSHPHICPVYDVGSQDGIDFLVMEFLEGETLAQRLSEVGRVPRSGPAGLPIDQALQIGIQLADALAAAHRTGIVHRDLKPGNIMLTKSGAKLLDFGLAKLTGPVKLGPGSDGAGNAGPAGSANTQAPTVTSPLTGAGTILGTLQYMAPEQLEGQEADARTDIFAFGAVVYEMVTGRRAFEGKSHASLIGAIMHGEPQALSTLAPVAPASLERVVRTCLAKDPDDRWQSARDLLRELRWIAESGSQVASAAVATMRAPAKRRAAMAFAVGIAVAMTAVAASVMLWSRASTPSPSVTRFVVQMPPSHDLFTGGGSLPAISADGRTLFYIGISTTGGRNIYRRPLDQLDAVAVPGVEGNIVHPFVSPDGLRLGFFADGRLRRVDLAGGSVVTVVDSVSANFGGTWLPDDIIAFTGTSAGTRRLFRVSAAGGVPTVLTNPDASAGGAHLYPQASPGAAVLAFTAWSGSLDSARVAVRSLETGEEKVLFEGTNPRLLSTGHLVYARQGSLWAVPFDAGRLEATGEPGRVLENIQVNNGGLALFTVSTNGTLAYVPGISGGQRGVVWVDRQGREVPLAVPPRLYTSVRVSPDGMRVALDTSSTAGENQNDVWIWDDIRAVLSRFTSEAARDSAPEWTPDGRRIVFSSTRGGSPGLFSQAVDGTGVAELLADGAGAGAPYAFTPDGAGLVVRHESAGAQAGLGLLTLRGPRRVDSLLSAGTSPPDAAMSPDGSWLAYESNESGQAEVYVRPFPNVNDGRWQVSGGGGTQPVWARTGGELFFAGPDGDLMSVAVRTTPTFSAGEAQLVLPARYFMTPAGRRRYDVSPDGQRFLMLKESTSRQIVVVQNWFEELKRLVPTN